MIETQKNPEGFQQNQKNPWTKNWPPKNPMPNFRALNFLESIKWYNTKNKLEIEWLCLRPGYTSTTTNLQIVLNTQKNPYLNQTAQENTCQIFLAKKIPESKISNPPNILRSSRHLKSGVPTLGLYTRKHMPSWNHCWGVMKEPKAKQKIETKDWNIREISYSQEKCNYKPSTRWP